MYLDHNAGTPPLPEVIAGLSELWRRHGNPSSIHATGRLARTRIEEAREELAALLGARARDLTFTSGGTEACNWAIRLARLALEPIAGRQPHAVASAMEHPAVEESLAQLETAGWHVERVRPESSGRMDPATFAAHLRPDTALTCLMLANNETGVLQPVAEISALVRVKSPSAAIVCDAVQAVGRIPVSVELLDVDAMALSAHKLGGLAGCGALWLHPNSRLANAAAQAPAQVGGKQERGLRGGTENLPGIWSLGVAARHARLTGLQPWADLSATRDLLAIMLRDRVPEAQVTGQNVERLPNTLHMLFPGLPSDAMLMVLDMAGFEASAGSACASGSNEPSRAMLALGLGESDARSVLRFSLAPGQVPEERDLVRISSLLGQLRERIRAVE